MSKAKQPDMLLDASQPETRPPNVIALAPPIVPDDATSSDNSHVADEEPEWSWIQNDAVVVYQQPATAIYVNPENAVVIRQEAPWYNEEDQILYLRPENVIAIVRRMLACAGHSNVQLVRSRGGGSFEDVE